MCVVTEVVIVILRSMGSAYLALHMIIIAFIALELVLYHVPVLRTVRPW